MITEASIKRVKFSPECIPDSWAGDVPLLGEVAIAPLDLRRFSPYLTILTGIQLTANANVALRARYDDARIDENTASMLSVQVGQWRLPAKSILYFNFFGLAAVVDYTTFFSLWAQQPTVAHKLLHGMSLSVAEKEIAERHGIAASVEKGLLPLPISQQIEREYHVMGEETHARSVTIVLAATPYQIESIYPRHDELIVLTKIAANPGLLAQAIAIGIDRDDDQNYAFFPTFPLSLVAGGEIDCFIPAIKEIRLWTQATVAPGAHLFRYTFQRIKLNNILRARFGMASKDELPGDVWEKVMGGVL